MKFFKNILFSEKYKTALFIIILLIVSSVLRLYAVGKVPPSPDWDEAALGWNAYSILHTGRDEYGKFLPVVMRSFDDYKPALYSYLIIPFLLIFGLTLEAVRMPSIVFGIATIIVVYFLCEELFHRKNLSFLIAFLLAISPWHIQFSRIAFESNVGLSLNIFGAYFFLKGLKKKPFLFLSLLSFCAGVYVYQSEKVFSPLLLFLLVGIYYKQIFSLSKKYLATLFLFGFLLVLPMGLFLITNPHALARAQGVSVFADTSNLAQTSLRLEQDHLHHDYLGLILDNRRVYFVKEIVANYLSHFDIKWLFITGDVSRHHAPFMGLMYLWELPFLLSGIYYFLFSDYSKKTKILIFGWWLLAPLPAAVTTGVPHAVRTLNFLPTWQLFTAFGIIGIFGLLRNKKKVRFGLTMLFFIIVIFNFFYYLDQYFVQQNYYNSRDWQYGYKSAVAYLATIPARHIVVSNQPPLDQSYMFFLFYLKYNPALYQSETKHVSGGFREDHEYGKYAFRPIVWSSEKKNPNTVYVGRPSDFPTDVHILKTIYYLNKTPAIEIVKGN